MKRQGAVMQMLHFKGNHWNVLAKFFKWLEEKASLDKMNLGSWLAISANRTTAILTNETHTRSKPWDVTASTENLLSSSRK